MLTPDDYYAIQRELLDIQRRVWEMFDHLGRLSPDEIECVSDLRDVTNKFSIEVGEARIKVMKMYEEACNEQ